MNTERVHYVVGEMGPKHFLVRKMRIDGASMTELARYMVKDGECDCPQSTYRGGKCKHLRMTEANFDPAPAISLDHARELTTDLIRFLGEGLDRVGTDVEPYERTKEGLICGLKLVARAREVAGVPVRLFLEVGGVPVTLRVEGK